MVKSLWENIFNKDHIEKKIYDLLGENYIFENLSPNELRFLQKIVHLREYRMGEAIFKQGELGVGMYIIVAGSVNINILDVHGTNEDNPKEILVTQLKQGDFFGEHALVELNGRRTASATAAEDVQVIGFFKPDLMEIVERSPLAGVKILFRLGEVLGKRLKETTSKISILRRQLDKLGSKKSGAPQSSEV